MDRKRLKSLEKGAFPLVPVDLNDGMMEEDGNSLRQLVNTSSVASSGPFVTINTDMTTPENISMMDALSSKRDSVPEDLVVNPLFNINNLPEEIIIEIFKHLTQNELGQASRVSRRWNAYARIPILWKKVDACFIPYGVSQDEIVSVFFQKLSSSVTHMKLDFLHDTEGNIWEGGLNFQKLCLRMKKICPRLQTLILYCAIFRCSLSSVITLCSKFLPNLKALIICMSDFRKDRRESQGHPKIEILDVSLCDKIGRYSQHSISKMPSLKKLNLCDGCHDNYKWLWHEDNVPVLHKLEVLHFGWTGINSRAFRLLQNHGLKLTKLFLCCTGLNDEDFSFSNSVFPVLETICLRRCKLTTWEGIISLIRSCQYLQNIYVDRDVAEFFVKHPFVNPNTSKLEIVKIIDKCKTHVTLEFMLD